jgi:hypothetical protein
VRHGLDVVDLENPEVCLPTVRLEERIMIGAEMPGCVLSMRYDVLVDVDLERVRDDARDPPLATTTKNDQLLLESQRRSDAGRHATLLNPGNQHENWQFETHRHGAVWPAVELPP